MPAKKFCRVILWYFDFFFPKAAWGLVWFSSGFWPIANDSHTTHTPYWPPIAHTVPIFVRLTVPLFATLPATRSACVHLCLWRELSPVTWGIKCMVETCILWGMQGRCRSSVGSAVVPRADSEGPACLRLCYWRSYRAGREIYCLPWGFHASLNLNLESWWSFRGGDFI